GEPSPDFRGASSPGRTWCRGVLPSPVASRQGRAIHPRSELHRLLLLEGVRQGRNHHLGDAADRLPIDRAGLAGVRAPWLPARRLVLLVHLLAVTSAVPVRTRGTADALARGPGAASVSRLKL